MSLTLLCAAAIPVDGDTLRCRGPEGYRGLVRIARIDSPELHGCRKRRCVVGDGRAAWRNLARLIDGRTVTCAVVDASPSMPGFQDRDRYGRPVARCRAGGIDLGTEQLAGGFAESWP